MDQIASESQCIQFFEFENCIYLNNLKEKQMAERQSIRSKSHFDIFLFVSRYLALLHSEPP
jgi:hypothetical protein